MGERRIESPFSTPDGWLPLGQAMKYIAWMRLTIEFDREDDGRWIAEVIEIPGVLVYGPSRGAALAAVQALALRAIADKLEHGELDGDLMALTFDAA